MAQSIINTSEVIISQMALNVSENDLPFLLQNMVFLIRIIQAFGIFLIIYMIYLLYNFFNQYKNRKRIKRIEEKVENIEKKIDKLLSNKKNHSNSLPKKR